jgi:hypothetical protein
MSSVAIAHMLLAGARQGPSMQEAPQPQHSVVRPRQPIVGGRHLQPRGTDLHDLGMPAPSGQEIEEMDRLMRQLLERSERGQGTSDRP